MRAASGRDFHLATLGAERDALPALAADAASQWTAGFNPRPVREADLLNLYESCY